MIKAKELNPASESSIFSLSEKAMFPIGIASEITKSNLKTNIL